MGESRTESSKPPLTAELKGTIDIGLLVEVVTSRVLARLEERLAQPSPWCDVDGAAAYLGCSPERIRKLVARKALPFHQERAGGRLFFSRSELDEWMLRL